jgi:hypothetical protein
VQRRLRDQSWEKGRLHIAQAKSLISQVLFNLPQCGETLRRTPLEVKM